jgi:pimeloyl-ACP methyl ester carboxylesterase
MTLEERSVEANGIRLHYLRSGGDKPPLVLAHGFSDSGACWASLIRVLTRDWDVVACDARGHGQSAAPKDGYSGEDQAEDVLGLIDALGLERPVLMGHSMGGETVAWAAIKRPEAIRAVVLEDSGLHSPRPGGSEDEQRDRLRKGLTAWIRSLQDKTADELVEMVQQNDPRWPDEDRRPWAESKLAISPEALDGFALARRRDVTQRYPGLRCPALFLKADAPEDERASHRALVATLADGEIVHVDGAGHNVRRDEQARTVYHLGRFLARV